MGMGNDARDGLVEGSDVGTEDLVTLLVVEAGASWPAWASLLGRAAQTNLIETEVSGETEAEFEARVMGRLSRLREHNKCLASAGYVAAPRRGRSTLRERICVSMLERTVPTGEFTLRGGYRLPSNSTQGDGGELIELWQRLSERGGPQLITVRFDEEAAPPSTFPGRLTDREVRFDATSKAV